MVSTRILPTGPSQALEGSKWCLFCSGEADEVATAAPMETLEDRKPKGESPKHGDVDWDLCLNLEMDLCLDLYVWIYIDGFI